MASVAPHLEPLVKPLSLFPNYTASGLASFIMKATNEHKTRDHRAVYLVDPHTGGPGQKFMEVDQPKGGWRDKSFVLIDSASGQEVMRVEKENHSFSPDIYRASSMGRQVFSLSVKEHSFSGDDYGLTIYPTDEKPMHLPVGYKVAGQKRAIMLDGHGPVATIDRPGSCWRSRREDVIHVAQGFDILLTLGVAYCHAEKEREKACRNTAVVVATA